MLICEKLDREIARIPPSSCGCLLYTRSRTWDGYARMETPGVYRVHVYVLEKKLGRKLSSGMRALHTCDVRNCVAEDHLYEGTQRQNVRDMYARGRRIHDSRGKRTNVILTENHVRCFRLLKQRGFSCYRMEQIFGVSARTISDIIRRITWKDIEASGRPTTAVSPTL